MKIGQPPADEPRTCPTGESWVGVGGPTSRDRPTCGAPLSSISGSTATLTIAPPDLRLNQVEGWGDGHYFHGGPLAPRACIIPSFA